MWQGRDVGDRCVRGPVRVRHKVRRESWKAGRVARANPASPEGAMQARPGHAGLARHQGWSALR